MPARIAAQPASWSYSGSPDISGHLPIRHAPLAGAGHPQHEANVSGARNGAKPKKPAARTWTNIRMRKIGSVAWSGSAADDIGGEDRTRAPALARVRRVDWYNRLRTPRKRFSPFERALRGLRGSSKEDRCPGTASGRRSSDRRAPTTRNVA